MPSRRCPPRNFTKCRKGGVTIILHSPANPLIQHRRHLPSPNPPRAPKRTRDPQSPKSHGPEALPVSPPNQSGSATPDRNRHKHNEPNNHATNNNLPSRNLPGSGKGRDLLRYEPSKQKDLETSTTTTLSRTTAATHEEKYQDAEAPDDATNAPLPHETSGRKTRGKKRRRIRRAPRAEQGVSERGDLEADVERIEAPGVMSRCVRVRA
ncbi:hypothetical protein M758_6G180400 [Ceratodon purpureus]|nr:hypothetical protein M758_6G180400 [Ceratodon purpureus]